MQFPLLFFSTMALWMCCVQVVDKPRPSKALVDAVDNFLFSTPLVYKVIPHPFSPIFWTNETYGASSQPLLLLRLQSTLYSILLIQKGAIHMLSFTCDRTQLLAAINIVSKAVSTRTTLPILECILIKTY